MSPEVMYFLGIITCPPNLGISSLSESLVPILNCFEGKSNYWTKPDLVPCR